ncbi:chemotaxis protein CheA [Paenibacillus sp.]|uniref:chemotaxis protein CheA n=1 Tax=Paenibacillus sp. TaxID=58172 RepID=UPI002D39AB35|nr:chemotaxis protein CheA [Paenibacillus sp.]HZG84251.1 chemotaxis protein CheA [Paenibacillus sp.]
MFDIGQYRDVYLEEAEDQIRVMEAEILRLAPGGANDEAIQRLFRAAHTLKGSSAALGLNRTRDLTHEMESVMDRIRSGELPVTKHLITLLLIGLDRLKLLTDEFAGEVEPGGVDVESFVEALRRFAEQPRVEPAPDRSAAEEAGAPREYRLHIDIRADCEMKTVRAMIIHRELNEWAKVVEMSPALDALDESFPGRLRLTIETDMPPEEAERFALSLTDVSSVRVEAAAAPPARSGAAPDVPQAGGEPEPSVKGKARTQTVRVSVERLDELMNLVGELVIEQTRIRRAYKTLKQICRTEPAVEDLGQINDHLTRAIGDLQENVMKLRMLPIEHVFNRFPRMVRDLEVTLGKEVRIQIEGGDTELDRTLIDDIGDPLIHLIRNALDHGIETPEERRRKGKDPAGTLRIRAFHEDNSVNVLVEDDGAGIDPEKVKRSAVRKGLISETKADGLSDLDAVKLIFEPGFSTAEVVSDVSGRGVGMDIVRSQIQSLNGSIEIDTAIDRGTTFRIKLPLTLAIITGLLVKSGGSTFIIPMGAVSEIVRASPGDIHSMHGEETIVLRSRVIPVVRLHQLLHLSKARSEKATVPIVVVQHGDRRAAIAVDELIGNQEVVIKSLGAYVGANERIAGATILGDGRVALILDAASLVQG